MLTLALAVAWLVNATSPRGIKLGYDYFRMIEEPGEDSDRILSGKTEENESVERDLKPVTHSEVMTTVMTTDLELASDPILERLSSKGLRGIRLPEVLAAFEEIEKRELGEIVFVDARDVAYFEEGHIPGAYPLNHYRLEEGIDQVMAACGLAEMIIVYCNGGECEDSEFVALDLVEFGLPSDNVRVYLGGIEEWKGGGRLIELGPRDSGDIHRID